MYDNFLIVARQVGVLFAMMAVGVVCHRVKFLREESIKDVLEVLVWVVTPCLIAHSFLRPFDSALLAGMCVMAAFSAFAVFVGMGLSYILVRSRGEPAAENVVRFCSMFSNAGFMGIPLEYALLGDMGVFYGSIYVLVFNILCWSLGVVVVCGSAKDVKVRSLFCNCAMLGIAIGLPFFLLSIRMPAFLEVPIRSFGEMNTPLAMIVIGYYLSSTKFVKVFMRRIAWTGSLIRLVLVPIVTLGVLWACREYVFPSLDATLCKVVVIAASAPVAAMSTVLAVKYEKDVSMSVGMVSGTTLLSVISMPVIVGFAMTVLGH